MECKDLNNIFVDPIIPNNNIKCWRKMSKICRTCLRKSETTFKINQTYEFGNSAAKISYILRFCIPELYLGLSTNPEICSDCKESLEVAYVFKKKCLSTEQLLGDYLKTIRCTGRSVELEDVLKYVNETKLGQKLPQANVVNAEDIISEWEDHDNEGATEMPLIEVRQSAPNPTNYYSNSEEIRFCEDSRLLYKRNKLSGASKGTDQQEKTPSNKPRNDTSPQLNVVSKDERKTSNFPKIASVFSLSETPDKGIQSLKANDGSSGATLDSTTSTRPSAPNPTNYYSSSEEIRFCEDTLLLYKRNKLSRVPQSTEQQENTSSSKLCKDTGPQLSVVNKNEQDACNFPKITSVFSLSDTPGRSLLKVNNIPSGATLDSTTSNDPHKAGDTTCGLKIDGIKDEPLDVEINSDCINFTYSSADEETLDASETASFENMRCDSALQGIIDSLPDMHDSNQYVDIPEFVQINNFGPKELEELRRQQLKLAQKAKNLDKGGDIDKKQTSSSLIRVQETGGVKKEVKNLPQTLYVNGKQMVKCGDGYKFLEEGTPQQIELEAQNQPTKFTTVATQVDSGPVRRPTRRRKFKIVPVGDKASTSSTTTPEEKSLTDDNRSVVVLFTNYTSDGFYINDHDYLTNPYKRNKLLIEKNNEWICMCYICHKEHKIPGHISHMSQHSGFCKICEIDLGTPYMLNGHVRTHIRPCKQCTESVPYGLIESHNKLHMEEEIKFEGTKKKHCRRKKMSKDEKPVYFPVVHTGESFKKDIAVDVSNGDSVVKKEAKEVDSKDKATTTPSKRSRKRRFKIEECSPPDTNLRVLRSKARKSYSETDLNISKSDSVDKSPDAEPP